jgi:hypothetical protein
LAGGRNDLMLFEFSGKSVVVEVFATASQVSRDLLILHKTKADKKIAIILDKEIDAKIFDKFLKENPDNVFPFLFVREIFEDTPISAYLKLKEIITGDDEAKFRRMLNERLSSENFIEWCQHNGIEVLSPDDLEGGEVTYSKVFVTIALVKLKKQGISKDKLRKIGIWLSEERTLEYIFMKVDIGFNMFLYTNLEDHFAAYSDMELTDWIRAGHYFSKPHILMSLNATIYEIEDQYLKSGVPFLNPERKISMTIGAAQSHETSTGRTVIYSLPSKVESVILLPPIDQDRPAEKYLELVKISSPDGTTSIG